VAGELPQPYMIICAGNRIMTLARAKPCGLRMVKARDSEGGQLQKDLSLPECLEEENAIMEAQLCLGTIQCQSCDLCRIFCPDLCITRDDTDGKILIDLNYCKGCGICSVVCPRGAIRMVLEKNRPLS
jgi:2-oxoacid:acceptor oxidoreductase delta subunit (pyruvate/2-ketoisovalerate family)